MYKLFCSGFNKEPNCVLLQKDNVLLTIPFDPANTDYQAYLKYKEEGGKVYGPDEEVPTGG